MDFSKRLYNIRKRRGMTQKELADKAGCTLRAISNYEAGDRVPKGQFLDKIADGLGVPKQALLSDSGYAEFLSQLDEIRLEDIVINKEKNSLLLQQIVKQVPTVFTALLLTPPLAISSIAISGSLLAAYEKTKHNDNILKKIYKEQSRITGLIVYLNERIDSYRDKHEQLAKLTQQDDADIDDYKKFIRMSQILSNLQEYRNLLKYKSKYCSILISEIEDKKGKSTDTLEKILSEIKEIEEKEGRLISTLKNENISEI